MREVHLANNRGVALVDDEDYKLVNQYRWQLNSRGYAQKKRADGVGIELMHTFILGSKPGLELDHINGNKLDNRRSNLRWATRSLNVANTGKRTPGTASSRYKGVSWNADNRRWQAYIRVDGRRLHLGYFAEEVKAALAYDAAALKYFGGFAKLNFPLEEVIEWR